jgi:hypothetical protein
MLPHERFANGCVGIPLDVPLPQSLDELRAIIEALPGRDPITEEEVAGRRIFIAQSLDGFVEAMDTIDEIAELEKTLDPERPRFRLADETRDFLLGIIDRAISEDGGFGCLVTVEEIDDSKPTTLVEFGFPNDVVPPKFLF